MKNFRSFRKVCYLSMGLIAMIGCSKEEEQNPSMEVSITDIILSDESPMSSVILTASADWSVELSSDATWLDVTPRSGEGGTHDLTVISKESNPTNDDRTASFTVKLQNLSKKITVTQKKKDAPVTISERDALIAIYNATDGVNWYDHENWLSDKPLSEWAGVETNEAGEVIELYLGGNNLNGIMPHEIGALKKLEGLSFSVNPLLKGNMPIEVFNLTNLTNLGYAETQITGTVPPEIGKLINLEELYLQGTGTLPEEIGNLQNLQDLMLCGVINWGVINEEEGNLSVEKLQALVNNSVIESFTGKLPDAISRLKNLDAIFLEACDFTDLSALNQLPNLSELGISINPWLTAIPAELNNPQITDLSISGTNISDLSGLKKLTGLTSLDIYSCPKITTFPMICCELPNLSNLYIEDNPGITGAIPAQIWDMKKLSNLYLGYNNLTGTLPKGITNAASLKTLNIRENKLSGSLPSDFFKHPTLKYYYFWSTDGVPYDLKQQPGYTLTYYESTDNSKEGEVVTLQSATQGNGVNLIFMGEGFLDTDMAANGYFELRMKEAMDHFFSLEPAKSYRNYFNVYAVKTISPNDFTKSIKAKLLFNYNKPKFFNVNKVLEIAGAVPGIDLNKTQVTVVVNSLPINYNADYSPDFVGQKWSDGKRVIAINTGDTKDEFNLDMNRYAVGLGFARLAYETYETPGKITSTAIASFNTDRKTYSGGWNLSLTNDAVQIPWKHFIGNAKYSMVGTYEGGYGYEKGVWRSENSSIMGDNILYFNAPSRELFVKRVKELAGETYSWDDFKARDRYEYPAAIKSAKFAFEKQQMPTRRVENKFGKLPSKHFAVKKRNRTEIAYPPAQCARQQSFKFSPLKNGY